MFLKAKTGEKKERYIVVHKARGEEAKKKMEEQQHAADLVSSGGLFKQDCRLLYKEPWLVC